MLTKTSKIVGIRKKGDKRSNNTVVTLTSNGMNSRTKINLHEFTMGGVNKRHNDCHKAPKTKNGKFVFFKCC